MSTEEPNTNINTPTLKRDYSLLEDDRFNLFLDYENRRTSINDSCASSDPTHPLKNIMDI